jgi:hypothetical protein
MLSGLYLLIGYHRLLKSRRISNEMIGMGWTDEI